MKRGLELQTILAQIDVLEELKKSITTVKILDVCPISYAEKYSNGSPYKNAFIDGEMEIYNLIDGHIDNIIKQLSGERLDKNL